MKRNLTRFGFFLMVISIITGCSAFAISPTTALITDKVKGPVAVGTESTYTKEGTACSKGILIYAWGDASIDTAMRNAGITKIAMVDSEAFNILGIYATSCTTVRGN